MLFTLFTRANSSQLSKACIHCADADNCHVLKTATMHSLLMTNARGDLISQLCHQSKIPQTRWLFLPGIHSDHADRKHHAHARRLVMSQKSQIGYARCPGLNINTQRGNKCQICHLLFVSLLTDNFYNIIQYLQVITLVQL